MLTVSRKNIFRFICGTAIVAFSGVLLCVALTFVLLDAKNPKVVLLYTQKEYIPDFAFRLGSVPLAIIAFAKYGEVTYAALPVTRANSLLAFQTAEVLIVGAHGDDGGFQADDGGLIFPPTQPQGNLKFAYIGSCSFGVRRIGWQAAFPNAELIGYDELAPQWRGFTQLLLETPLKLLRI